MAIGLPCVTVAREDALRLQSAAESEPGERFIVDLEGMTVRAGDFNVVLQMPSAARDAFLDGSWDATGLLLEGYDEVRAVAQRLPYIAGW